MVVVLRDCSLANVPLTLTFHDFHCSRNALTALHPPPLSRNSRTASPALSVAANANAVHHLIAVSLRDPRQRTRSHHATSLGCLHYHRLWPSSVELQLCPRMMAPAAVLQS